jgi:hypothetical protein
VPTRSASADCQSWTKEYERRDAGLVSSPIFLLVPQVKLPQQPDLVRDAERVGDAVPGLIVANWVEGR